MERQRGIWGLCLMMACSAVVACAEGETEAPLKDTVTVHDAVKTTGLDAGLTDVEELPTPEDTHDGDAGPEDSPQIADFDAPESDTSPEVQPTAPPTYPHLDTVIDLNRGDVPTWAHLIHVDLSEETPAFYEFDYDNTADSADFWPASTIKIYPATAALTLIKKEGFSLDAKATFYHHNGQGWVEDVTQTFREMIFDSFNCSSNSAYTLLLRFAGVDWINTEYFTPENGFAKTALMVGYVSARPYAYKRQEAQRIVVQEGDKEWERVHEFSGAKYANDTGCSVFYAAGAANCSSPRDMTEHMRRVMFHEHLQPSEQFDVHVEDLDWLRFGGSDPVMNNKETCGSHGWKGVKKVLPDADFYHKAGAVGSYRLDLQYVSDEASDTHYILAVVTKTGSGDTVAKLSEEVARVVKTPGAYVHLDTLTDHVNPVTADLVVYSEGPGSLELIVKDFDLADTGPQSWEALGGTLTEVSVGLSSHSLISACLDSSQKLHIRGRLSTDATEATSDLHYVIVDADVSCP